MNKKLVIGISALLIALAVILSIASFANDSSGLSQEEAIQAVIASHPELAAYETTSLPPSSIEAKKTGDAWYVGFIQSGSGVPGILHAECYRVTDAKSVSATGIYAVQNGKTAESITLETCEPVFAEESPAETLAYGSVTLKLNDIARFKDISIRPLSIEEDSRCPKDVQCIWAGQVRVRVQMVSSTATSTSILTMGQAFTTEGRSITLTTVMPAKSAGAATLDEDYRLTFNVVPQGVAEHPGVGGKCYVGGCSAQLCTDSPNAVSTCIYDPAYACYKSATCERQPSGQCGWTETAALKSCLLSS